MWVAKLERTGQLVEVLKVGSVKFDPRPGWLLVSTPIGARPRHKELRWIHPDDTPLTWLREFNF